METEEHARHIRRAHELFVTGSEIPSDLVARVRPEIYRSWCRSRRSGADPAVPRLVMSGEIDPTTKLQIAASPVFDRLSFELAGAPVAVYLADAHGVSVRRWAEHPEIRRRLETIQSYEGMSASEDLVGTNALGTSIEDRINTLVAGPEHYAVALQVFTCASAPIFRPASRQVAGAITLTCRDVDRNELLKPFVSQMAAEISERLFLDRSLHERILLFEFMKASKRTTGAVVAVSETMVMTNPQAVRLLEGTEQSRLWEMASRSASDWDTEGEVVALAHQEARVRCQPVTDGLQVFAYVLELEVIAERATKPTWQSQPGRFMRNLVGRSSGWLRVDHLARNASASTVPLLVRGRSGVGKFAVVKEIHADADRWGPTTVFDASLLPVHGVARWMGRVEAALQMPRGVVVITHLERVGEAGDVLAGLLELHADTRCRVVTTLTDGATGADQVNQGLLDRVGRLTITVPTLRDRYEDLPDLVGHLTRQASGRTDPPHWTSNALQALGRLEWPGNVRELDNVVRSVVMARPIGAISATDLPDEVRARAHRSSLTQMERAEADAMVAALIEASGNKAEAATALGISRSTLYRKLRAYGLDLDRLTY